MPLKVTFNQFLKEKEHCLFCASKQRHFPAKLGTTIYTSDTFSC